MLVEISYSIFGVPERKTWLAEEPSYPTHPGFLTPHLGRSNRINYAVFVPREWGERRFFANRLVFREAPRLYQSEVAGDEKHHHNNADDVKNTAHVSCSFLARDRISAEPGADDIKGRETGRGGSLDLPSE